MFHELATTCADCIAGERSSVHSKPAWQQCFRALEHKQSKNQCRKKEMINKFPAEITAFATHYVTMQDKRHAADYDPYEIVSELDVAVDLAATEKIINNFRIAPESDKRAFCAYVLLKLRGD